MPRLHTRLSLRLAILCGIAFLPAHGQAEDQTPQQRFLGDSHLKQNVINTAAKSTVMVRHPCSGATYTAAQPVELRPMKFNELGGPVEGELRFPVTETGCGAEHALNVYVWVQRENSIAVTPMMPGSSHADSDQQKTAYAYVLAAAGGPEPNCQTTYVEDTKFEAETGKPSKGLKISPWKETWTLSSCGWRAEVPVTFTPDLKGLKVTAGPKSAVKRLPPEENKL